MGLEKTLFIIKCRDQHGYRVVPSGKAWVYVLPQGNLAHENTPPPRTLQ